MDQPHFNFNFIPGSANTQGTWVFTTKSVCIWHRRQIGTLDSMDNSSTYVQETSDIDQQIFVVSRPVFVFELAMLI